MAWQDLPIVLVTWRDAHADAYGWASIDELDLEPCLVHSVGFQLEQRKPGHITILQSIIVEEVDSVLHIPTDMVVSIRTLEVENAPFEGHAAAHHPVLEKGKSPRIRRTGNSGQADPPTRAGGSLTERN